jgi:hypothetical protein
MKVDNESRDNYSELNDNDYAHSYEAEKDFKNRLPAYNKKTS